MTLTLTMAFTIKKRAARKVTRFYKEFKLILISLSSDAEEHRNPSSSKVHQHHR